jgi:hypothetical protein
MLIFGIIAGFTKLQLLYFFPNLLLQFFFQLIFQLLHLQLQIKFFQLLLLILQSFAGELSKTTVWGSYHIAVKSIIFVEMKVVDYIFHQTSPSYI